MLGFWDKRIKTNGRLSKGPCWGKCTGAMSEWMFSGSGVIILNSDLGVGAGRLLGRMSQLEVELSQDKNHMTQTRGGKHLQRQEEEHVDNYTLMIGLRNTVVTKGKSSSCENRFIKTLRKWKGFLIHQRRRNFSLELLICQTPSGRRRNWFFLQGEVTQLRELNLGEGGEQVDVIQCLVNSSGVWWVIRLVKGH